jgi:ADP-heptose:LPS heptosyltransferase
VYRLFYLLGGKEAMGKKKVILYNLQPRLGDALMLTPAVRDFKKTYPEISLGVMTAIPAIFENNPYVDAINPNPTDTELHKLGPSIVSNGSKTNGLHIAESFGLSLSSKSEYKLKPSYIKPDIHLSDIEKKQLLVAGDYWVIAPSHGTGYTSKQWVIDRWQQLVDSMPYINFVQTGDLQSNETVLKGKNVCYDLIGNTNIRELFQLIYHSKGVVSLISAPMHIAGAFNKPCVVIAGGREPRTFEAYENHQFISKPLKPTKTTSLYPTPDACLAVIRMLAGLAIKIVVM